MVSRVGPTSRTIGAALAAVAGASFAALAAQPTTVTESPSAPLDPVFDLSFVDAWSIPFVLFSPDGATIYAGTLSNRFNVWALAVHFWPEGLGVLATLACVVLMAWMIRIATRRRRRAGEFHCLRCNYCLTGASSPTPSSDRVSRCPECAADLARHRPVLGLQTRRRLRTPALLLTLLVCAAGAMWGAGLPRNGSASFWFCIESPAIEKWLTARNPTLAGKVSQTWQHVLALDATTGATTRTVWRGASWSSAGALLSPDGASMYLISSQDAERLTVRMVDLRNGTTRAALSLPRGEWELDAELVALSPRADKVYIAFADQQRTTTGVLEWTPASGASRRLFEEPAYVNARTRASRPFATCRRFYLLPDPNELRFVSAPSFSEAFETNTYVVRVHEGDRSHEFPVGPFSVPGLSARPESVVEAPMAMPDGQSILVPTLFMPMRIDLATGEATPLFEDNHRLIVQTHVPMVIDPSGRTLVLPGGDTRSAAFGVRDLVRSEWAGSLRTPQKMVTDNLCISPDGKCVAAIGFTSTSGTPSGPYVRRLALFDLTPVYDRQAALDREHPPK